MVRSYVKISALAPKQEILGEESGCGDVFTQCPKLRAKQNPPTDADGSRHRDDQCGKYSSDAAIIEPEDREPIALQIQHQNAGDQVSRNNEEDINANKSTREQTWKCVKKYDRGYGHCPQAVYIRSVFLAMS